MNRIIGILMNEAVKRPLRIRDAKKAIFCLSMLRIINSISKLKGGKR
ncbi:hypothetical protein MUSASHINO07_13730 [Gemella sp. Musashino-2025]